MGSEGAGLRRSLRPAVCAGLLLTAAIALGCGGDDDGRDRAARPAAQAQVAGTLRPDGTVPWVDERAGEQDLVAPDPHRHRPSSGEAASASS